MVRDVHARVGERVDRGVVELRWKVGTGESATRDEGCVNSLLTGASDAGRVAEGCIARPCTSSP
eukprot:6796578-Prymnesium_polylepis.2